MDDNRHGTHVAGRRGEQRDGPRSGAGGHPARLQSAERRGDGTAVGRDCRDRAGRRSRRQRQSLRSRRRREPQPRLQRQPPRSGGPGGRERRLRGMVVVAAAGNHGLFHAVGSPAAHGRAALGRGSDEPGRGRREWRPRTRVVELDVSLAAQLRACRSHHAALVGERHDLDHQRLERAAGVRGQRNRSRRPDPRHSRGHVAAARRGRDTRPRAHARSRGRGSRRSGIAGVRLRRRGRAAIGRGDAAHSVGVPESGAGHRRLRPRIPARGHGRAQALARVLRQSRSPDRRDPAHTRPVRHPHLVRVGRRRAAHRRGKRTRCCASSSRTAPATASPTPSPPSRSTRREGGGDP